MRALLLLSMVLLAGCFGGFGDCDFREPMVRFEDPDLWHQLRNQTPMGWVSSAEANGLLPFADPDMDARFAPYGLMGVTGPSTGLPGPDGGREHRDHPYGHIAMTGRHASITLHEDVAAEQVRPWAQDFIDHVSAAPRDTRDAWVDSFLAERIVMLEGRGPHGDFRMTGYAAEVTGPLRLGDLFRSEAPSLQIDGNQVLAVGNWTFRFHVDPIIIEQDGAGFEAHFDGTAWYHGAWPQEDIGEELALSSFERAYASLGLGPAPPAQYEFSGAIC